MRPNLTAGHVGKITMQILLDSQEHRRENGVDFQVGLDIVGGFGLRSPPSRGACRLPVGHSERSSAALLADTSVRAEKLIIVLVSIG